MVNQHSFSPAAVLPAPYRSEAPGVAREFSARVTPEVTALRRTYYATEGQPPEVVLSLLTELDAELGRR